MSAATGHADGLLIELGRLDGGLVDGLEFGLISVPVLQSSDLVFLSDEVVRSHLAADTVVVQALGLNAKSVINNDLTSSCRCNAEYRRGRPV